MQGVTVKDGDGEGTDYDALLTAAADLRFSKPLRCRQVHGSRVLTQNDEGFGSSEEESRPEADAVVGSDPGVLGVVSVADCVPAFLLEPGSIAWAIVHAGWRGVAAGVLPNAIRTLAEYSRASAERMELYLGPSICGGCYEIGADVARKLDKSGDGVGISCSGGKYYVDLRAILKSQAHNAGIPMDSIAISQYCTRCHNNLFCSFRTEGEAGLRMMWAIIGSYKDD